MASEVTVPQLEHLCVLSTALQYIVPISWAVCTMVRSASNKLLHCADGIACAWAFRTCLRLSALRVVSAAICAISATGGRLLSTPKGFARHANTALIFIVKILTIVTMSSYFLHVHTSLLFAYAMFKLAIQASASRSLWVSPLSILYWYWYVCCTWQFYASSIIRFVWDIYGRDKDSCGGAVESEGYIS